MGIGAILATLVLYGPAACGPEGAGGTADAATQLDGAPLDGVPLDGAPLDGTLPDTSTDGTFPDATDDGGGDSTAESAADASDAADANDANDANDAADAADGSDAGPRPLDVWFQVRGEAAAPTWAALQDGDGAFARVLPDAAGALHATIADATGRYALAWSCETPPDPALGRYERTVELRVLVATLAELASATIACDEGARAPTANNEITTTGLAASGEQALHYFGYTGNYLGFSVETGRGDLLSVVEDMATGKRLRGALARDVAPSAPLVVDLAPAASAPFGEIVSFRPTGTPIGCGSTAARLDVERGKLWFHAERRARAGLGYVESSCSTELKGQLVPAALRGAKDAHVLDLGVIGVVGPSSVDFGRGVSIRRVFRATPASNLVEIPVDATTAPSVVGASFGVDAGGRCTFALATSPGDRFYTAAASTYGSVRTDRRIVVTPARAGASPALTFPDLAAAPGYDATYGAPDCASGWRLSAVRSSAALGAALQAQLGPTASAGDVELLGAWVNQP